MKRFFSGLLGLFRRKEKPKPDATTRKREFMAKFKEVDSGIAQALKEFEAMNASVAAPTKEQVAALRGRLENLGSSLMPFMAESFEIERISSGREARDLRDYLGFEVRRMGVLAREIDSKHRSRTHDLLTGLKASAYEKK